LLTCHWRGDSSDWKYCIVQESGAADTGQAGQSAAAHDSYKASLAIAEGLAKADPNNAGWQRDFLISYWKLAKHEPWVCWLKVVNKLEQMDRSGILQPIDRKWIAIVKANLAKLRWFFTLPVAFVLPRTECKHVGHRINATPLQALLVAHVTHRCFEKF
jgi:hypothetical protein